MYSPSPHAKLLVLIALVVLTAAHLYAVSSDTATYRMEEKTSSGSLQEVSDTSSSSPNPNVVPKSECMYTETC